MTWRIGASNATELGAVGYVKIEPATLAGERP